MRTQFNITTANNAQEGLEKLKNEGPFDVIISDFRMPHMDGAEFLRRAREVDPMATRILLTGQASLEGLKSAVNDGQVHKVLLKPCSHEELRDAMSSAIRQRTEKKATNEQVEELLKS